MTTLTATLPLPSPPAWAVLERQLFDALDRSVQPFLEKYTREDGTLIWRETFRGRDTDDLYEGFYNWPLLYLLGGGDPLLPLSVRQWDAVTRQLTDYGVVHKDYARCIDQFHQGESDLYFYFLCLADPARMEHVERGRWFAGLYMNEDPEALNYDPERKLIRAPLNGSDGPHWGFFDGEPSYGYSPGMARYGLPYEDVPGVGRYEDLKDPALARRLGEVMQARMGKGDVVGNLAVTSLVTNAYLLTGEEKYRRWVVDYVDAWAERARQNGGLLPDNVGLSGQVGEYMDGKWYGGLYGWTWPHGFYNVGMAAVVAGTNAYLLTGDEGYLDLPRAQMDRVMELGGVRDLRACDMSLPEHWVGQALALGEQRETFVVPYRHGDSGWFDYQPMSPIYPVAVWNLSMAPGDWERVERVRRAEPYDWRQVFSFRTKEDAGHEQPWTRYLAGENPGYPEQVLGASYAGVCRRLDQIREDREDLTRVNIHHWQQLNPVTTEALVQLTLGAPQAIYNGGLLMARVRYFDAERKRPGLPPDVAALVEKLEAGRTVLRLVNLSPFQAREVIVQAGAFGEHRFTEVRYDARTSDYPGVVGDYAAPPLGRETRTASVQDRRLRVHMPPATEITLDLGTERFVHNPSYAAPW
ncbi:MAG: hypothetical protein EXS64_15720 [Candidatus Latescibacteria bacterium]|nr:hypothetical protein [Candidatus Latescibacterota bacterium]